MRKAVEMDLKVEGIIAIDAPRGVKFLPELWVRLLYRRGDGQKLGQFLSS